MCNKVFSNERPCELWYVLGNRRFDNCRDWSDSQEASAVATDIHDLLNVDNNSIFIWLIVRQNFTAVVAYNYTYEGKVKLSP
jgi:hypothetical protein